MLSVLSVFSLVPHSGGTHADAQAGRDEHVRVGNGGISQS